MFPINSFFWRFRILGAGLLIAMQPTILTTIAYIKQV